MSHWLALPVILPAFMAPFIVLAARYHLSIQRALSVASLLALIALGAGLVWATADGDIMLYQMGDWAAPFGIVLVGDRLSSMMVLLTAVLALFVLLYSIGSGWDTRGRHFHALYQFQLMGILGAFLTGDLFNLFVFFEVLLIASYGLMIHGGGNARLKAGVQYVLFNLLGSTLFLFALGSIYAETGTLNMADLALRLQQMDEGTATAGLRVAAVLLILVFAIKAALVPLHFWLPSSYAEAPAPVAALFAIMTKVGAYAIIRVYTITFPADLPATQGLHEVWLLPAALVSVAVGALGVLAARKLDRLVTFAVISSMGTVLVAVGVFTEVGIAAALYYMIHSTLAAAILFLVVDLTRSSRANLALETQAPVAGAALIAGLFFFGAIAMTGLPPLSGFLGKIMVLQAGFTDPSAVWIWAVILISSLVSVVGFGRAGSTLYWKANTLPVPADAPPAPGVMAFGAALGLAGVLVAVTVLAGPIHQFTQDTAAQLFDGSDYIEVVTGTPGKLSPPLNPTAEGS
ncbi:MAG: monovalent cation/H+ antiporter subunit D [Pseudomonadota bacterium]